MVISVFGSTLDCNLEIACHGYVYTVNRSFIADQSPCLDNFESVRFPVSVKFLLFNDPRYGIHRNCIRGRRAFRIGFP